MGAGLKDSAATGFQPNLWFGLRRWIAANTFVPGWLTGRWQHPLFAYVAAIVAQLIAAGVIVLIVRVIPVFRFPSSVPILAVILVSLTWGTGPGILATLAGTACLDVLFLPVRGAGAAHGVEDLLSLALFVVIGFTASFVGGQSERRRRALHHLAGSLDEQRARLDTIIEAVPDIVTIHDAQGTLLRRNRAARSFHPREPGDVPLSAILDQNPLQTPGGTALSVEELPVARALRGEASPSVEIQAPDSDGHVRHLISNAAAFHNAQGQVLGFVAVTHDVTELHLAQQDAAERAATLQAIIEAMIDGVAVYDANARVVQTNAALRTILALEMQTDLLSQPLEARVSEFMLRDETGAPLPADQWPPSRVLRGEVLTGEKALDIIVRSRNGSDRQFSLTGAPIRDAQGRIGGAVLVFHDVTQRRRLERRTHDALTALLAMARALVRPREADEHDEVGAITRRLGLLTRDVLGCRNVNLIALTPEGTLDPVTVVGLPPDQEARWRERISAWPVENGLSHMLEERLRSGEIIAVDTRRPEYAALANPFGIERYLLVPLRIGTTTMGILTVEYGADAPELSADDRALIEAVAQLAALVLEREQLQNEREEARARALALHEANQRMDEFLSIASHELRSPLTSILGMLQLLRRRARRDAEWAGLPRDGQAAASQVESMAERAEEQARRLNRLIEDLLDVSRIQSGHLEVHQERSDLMAIVRESVEEQRTLWPTRTVTVEAPAESVTADLDADRIRQVIKNYLTNALKYSPPASAVIVSIGVEDGEVWVRVRDRGPGLTPEQQEHIWDRYRRVPGVAVQDDSGAGGGGLGLGLYISRTIVEAHGGRVGVEGVPGEGSVFWFSVPISRQ